MSLLVYPKACPVCDSPSVARIIFGLPSNMDEIESELESSKAILGGCSVLKDSPQWHCCECSHEWGISEWASYLAESEAKLEAEIAAKEASALARGVKNAYFVSESHVRCPYCQRSFSINSDMSWDGIRHKSCGTYLILAPK